MTKPHDQAIEVLDRPKLLADLEWLLAEGRKLQRFTAPEIGRHFDDGATVIRRIASGQTVAISLRYVEAIIAELKVAHFPTPESAVEELPRVEQNTPNQPENFK